MPSEVGVLREEIRALRLKNSYEAVVDSITTVPVALSRILRQVMGVVDRTGIPNLNSLISPTELFELFYDFYFGSWQRFTTLCDEEKSRKHFVFEAYESFSLLLEEWDSTVKKRFQMATALLPSIGHDKVDFNFLGSVLLDHLSLDELRDLRVIERCLCIRSGILCLTRFVQAWPSIVLSSSHEKSRDDLSRMLACQANSLDSESEVEFNGVVVGDVSDVVNWAHSLLSHQLEFVNTWWTVLEAPLVSFFAKISSWSTDAHRPEYLTALHLLVKCSPRLSYIEFRNVSAKKGNEEEGCICDVLKGDGSYALVPLETLLILECVKEWMEEAHRAVVSQSSSNCDVQWVVANILVPECWLIWDTHAPDPPAGHPLLKAHRALKTELTSLMIIIVAELHRRRMECECCGCFYAVRRLSSDELNQVAANILRSLNPEGVLFLARIMEPDDDSDCTKRCAYHSESLTSE